jgi:hypothetical protein
MATCTILLESQPYYTVRVEFADQQFDQTLVCEDIGGNLVAQLQAYADEYQDAWISGN